MKVAGVVVALVLALAAPAHAAPGLVKLGDFSSPTYATSAPDDGNRIYVVEKPGVIRIAGQAAPFLDLTADTLSDDTERGLLSMAFAPDYATSGRFYVYLTAKPNGEIQIREYRRSAANPYIADPATALTLTAIPHGDAANHNGGQLQFGPDGKLYAGTGDGGGSNDQFHHSQDPNSRLGKLLTIDPNAGGASVVARGLRNPWRFSFDGSTIVIADVGQDQREEVNVGLADNYGWPCREGAQAYLTDPGCDGAVLKEPVFEQPHSAGFCSITGGYVIRDPGLPTLLGRYIYGDYCNAPLRSVDLANPASDAAVGLSVSGLSSFGQDACGRILVVSLEGPVSRLVDGAPSACAGSTAPPVPKDAQACKLSARVVRYRASRLTLSLRSDEACRATISARVRGVTSFTRVAKQLAAGKRTSVALRLSKRNARKVRGALRRHRSLRVAIRLATADAAGNRKTLNRVFHLRRP